MPGYMQKLRELGNSLGKIEGVLDTALPSSLAASSVVDAEMTGVWHKTLMGITAYDPTCGQLHRMLEGTAVPAHFIFQFGTVNGSVIGLALGLVLSAGLSFGLYKASDHVLKAAYGVGNASEAGDVPSVLKKVPVYVFLAGSTAVRVASGIMSWPV